MSGRPRALVTGASRGIGRAIAAALLAEGYDVVGTCRNPRALPQADRLAGVSYLPLDLASERSIERLVLRIGQTDVLVNNAGMSQIGPAEEAESAALRRLYDVNFFGPVRLTQLLALGMRERQSGAIVTIGSLRSEVPSPFCSAYASAKAAIRSFSDALRLELAPYGVRVYLVAPSHVRTTFPIERVMRERSPYAERMEYAGKRRDKDIADGTDPALIGKAVAAILRKRPRGGFYAVGNGGPILAFLLRHVPRRVVDFAARRLFDKV